MKPILTDQQVRKLIVDLAEKLPEVDRPAKKWWWRK